MKIDMTYWCESCARKNNCYTIRSRPKCFVAITNTDRKTEPNPSEIPTSKIIEAYAKGWTDGAEAVKDEPQTEMTTEQIVNELLSIKKILDDGKMPKQTHEIRTNTHECVKDTHDKTKPQMERRCGNCKHLTYRWNKVWCDIKCDNPHDMVCDKWERSE